MSLFFDLVATALHRAHQLNAWRALRHPLLFRGPSRRVDDVSFLIDDVGVEAIHFRPLSLFGQLQAGRSQPIVHMAGGV
jgi:hypothetical protein